MGLPMYMKLQAVGAFVAGAGISLVANGFIWEKLVTTYPKVKEALKD